MKDSPIVRGFMGATLGFVLHVVMFSVLVLALSIAMTFVAAFNPYSGSSKFAAEGIFWIVIIALMSSPSGMLTGVVAALVADMREKSLPKATVVGAIPSVFGTVAAASFFAMLGQPNLPIPGALLFSGLATAAVVVFVFRRSA